MESAQDYYAMRAALEWQVELGANEALSEAPVNRFELVEKVKAKPAVAAAAPQVQNVHVEALKVDAVAVARAAAEAAQDLAQLRVKLEGFEHCELKRGARNLVFGDGAADARVMIIGEAPDREGDREGKPFVGQANALLGKMLGAIGLSLEESVYATTVMPWRLLNQSGPSPEEVSMMRPFMARHVALAKPDLVILMGNISCDAALGQRGITRLRGTWAEAYGVPAMPMFPPETLLRQPHLKREAWADLLEIKARLT
ncbi:uracil-DNA glycosylase [Lentibacter sp. XHP0401]|uniref:uracil-DNA glycosylase n=1 Tax=Lentibacter sp. XHP0401 TaxID=2984334 RepID=UPI0021E99FC8|nr:uracil-DNA glycosylase [Lentibacter sp. XHP0401]MCV2892916.1 uracil-DNA glycosylase [Lentibacter sp. XHP0401]